ncbi:hypothetical protein [Microbacterium sp. LWH11-1.2]|uniref:hypothetical protein n=1 Tax=Microbacterium sp. LWH11-1.2 TaxID=3135258 RepID=UPI003139911A
MAVTPATIAVALGVPAPDSGSTQEQQWGMWIDDATMLIELRAEQVGVEYDSIDEVKVDYVVRQAVVSHVQKPDDATQVTIQVDDAMSTKSYKSGKGRVSILDEWWALLGLSGSSGAFSLDMAPDVCFPAPSDWFPVTTDDWRGWP